MTRLTAEHASARVASQPNRRSMMLRIVLGALLSAFCVSSAIAQSYPSRPVRIVVPASAGGTVDLLTRAVAIKLADHLGQPTVIENRAGATTSIAEEYVVRQPADGYTLMMSGITLATQPFMRANLPYDPQRDLAMISLVAVSGNVIVVNPSLAAKTVPELIALAKSSPRPLLYGTAAFGATGHLAAEMFNLMAGTKLSQVPYKGAAPALNDLIAGQIDMTFDNIPAAINHIRSGRIRAIAVTSPKRDRQLPDVPTIAEAGLPGYEIVAWFGLVAPAGTPPEIIARLHADTVKSLQDPGVLDRLEKLGFEAVGNSPSAFAAYVRSQADALGKVIRSAGIKPQ
ncbi:MAG: tripartite tricarboxylate transporter substrate binding protein [Betaproteobacteria bacterium]|nr:tripartite tricarboxylate transporter substrate binding protein [Betaproteobacteria bacterium]